MKCLNAERLFCEGVRFRGGVWIWKIFLVQFKKQNVTKWTRVKPDITSLWGPGNDAY